MEPLPGAPQALRRLEAAGIRIRVITHRLVVGYTHETSVAQTVKWLDHHGVPYWDLCFMRDKGAVGADLYVEDSPANVEALMGGGHEVIVMTQRANAHLDVPTNRRAAGWEQAERLILDYHAEWREGRAG